MKNKIIALPDPFVKYCGFPSAFTANIGRQVCLLVLAVLWIRIRILTVYQSFKEISKYKVQNYIRYLIFNDSLPFSACKYFFNDHKNSQVRYPNPAVFVTDWHPDPVP
jgi:hypothetical protein